MIPRKNKKDKVSIIALFHRINYWFTKHIYTDVPEWRIGEKRRKKITKIGGVKSWIILLGRVHNWE